MEPKPFLPVVELTRGKLVESIHFGALAVVDSAGNLVASLGDPNRVAFLRSSAKPLQVLPFIEAGGHTHYDFTAEQIAVMCASHSGTDAHIQTIRTILSKIGLDESSLMCGTHPPYHAETARRLAAKGEEPSSLHHNCSGKHSGMLAYTQMLRAPLDSYLEQSHPVQQQILQTIAEMCNLDPQEIVLGIDGCSAPVFAVPIYHAAWAWARLVDPRHLPETRANACRTITSAIAAYPNMVAGPGRFDTVLMESGGGRVIAKDGAEGFQALGIPPGTLGPGSPGLGIAIKIADGDRRGTVAPMVALEVLRQLGVLDDQIQQRMADFGPVVGIKNWRQISVGEMHLVFKLNDK